MSTFPCSAPRRAMLLCIAVLALGLLLACAETEETQCPNGQAVTTGTLCFTIDSGTQVTRTSGVAGGAFTASRDTDTGEFTLGTDMTDPTANPDVELTLTTNGEGTFTYAGSSADLSYYIGASPSWDSIWLVDSQGSCSSGVTSLTVTINSFGVVGQPVIGTFTGTVVEYDFNGSRGVRHRIYCSEPSTIQGAFNVTRGADTSGS